MLFQKCRRTLSFIFILVLLLSASPSIVADDSVVVLMYHRFNDSRFPSTNIKLEQFEAQLSYLRDQGYAVVPLKDVVAAVAEGKPLPPRAVAITVDDAYRSVYEAGFPRFRKYGFPFTVFVATDPVDQGLRDYMSWDQMREMQTHDASFANHSATHNYLINQRTNETKNAWRKRVRADIDKGRQRLIKELTPLLTAFAYPFGEYNSEVADILRDAGYIAFGQQSGTIGPHSDPRALPRFPMAEAFADMNEFRIKVASLPLPVLKVQPWDPVVKDSRPSIMVTLGKSDARLDQLACYVSGLGRNKVEWDKVKSSFLVRPESPLRNGRQRVNCTAPRADGRYYWFSHPWIVRTPQQ